MISAMTTQDDLYQAILEDPFDDDLRLIYADFLEEHGQGEGAKFIRESLRTYELFKCPTLNGWWYDRSNKGYYLTPFRGINDFLSTTTEEFEKNVIPLFKQYPITWVCLTDKAPRQLEVLSSSGNNRSFSWWWGDWGSEEWGSAFVIPIYLVRHRYPDPEIGRTRYCCGHEISKAYDWLSQLCVDFGRRCAGLPPLDWSKQR